MKRPPKLSVPMTLSFVVVAAATFAGPWVACGGSSSSGGSTTQGTSGGGSTASAGGAAGHTSMSTTNDDQAFCLPGPDAGPHQKCPDMLDAGEMCPPGCQIEVV